jgi:protein-S-isoprenylcysteine O-methyltransferase Ste14
VRLAGKLRRIHGHLVLAVVGFVLARPAFPTNLVGSALILAGMVVRVWAAGMLEKGGDLCTDGPYRFVRHPLYLGSTVAAVGFAVMMNVIWGWVLIIPLFAALYAGQVLSEERHLRTTYGAAHAQFAAAVPLIVPLPGRAASGTGRRWRLSLVLMNREHYHVVVTASLTALLFVKPYLVS